MIAVRVLTTAAFAILVSAAAVAAKEANGFRLAVHIKGIVATPAKVTPGGAATITWRADDASSCWVLDRGRTTPPVYPDASGTITGQVVVTPIADTANVTFYAVFCRDTITDFVVSKLVTVTT